MASPAVRADRALTRGYPLGLLQWLKVGAVVPSHGSRPVGRLAYAARRERGDRVSSFRRSGDGFMRCSDGHVRWGIFGAAGVLFVWRSRGIEGLADGTPLVMLQQRSAWAHEGGTWSCAGGALDEGETAYEGALREASEEVGEIPEAHRVLGEYVFAPATDWTYTTLVVEVDRHFGASVNFETDAVVWVPCDLVEHRPLHAGFAAAWPHLRAIVEAPAHEAPGVSDDAPS